MRKIKLHWWILLGMIAGVVWGVALHGAYYDDLLEQARQQVLGQGYSPEALIGATREINTALQGLMNQTPAGAAAHGLAELFLSLLRMIVIPLVFASLVCGVTGMRDFARVRRIGARAAAWYITTSLLAILLGLALVNIFQPGVGLDLPMAIGEVDIPAPSGPWEMALSVVPNNVVGAAASFDLLGLIFFAILFGIFTLKVEERFLNTIDGFFQ